jgi:colanic acid biosynthesis glycosyl transferase WcaI
MGAGGLVRGMRLAERLLFNRCDALIVLSDSMRRELCGLGVTRPIHVLPIWTDTHEIQPLDRPGGAPPTAIYSGNFGRKQGLDQVLAMAPILRAEVPDVRIVLRGDGSEKARLEKTAREEGLTHVRFEPLAAREKFAAALADGDVHLVPQDPSGSNYAVPSKIYSILAAGRPFVCTAQPGSGLWDLAQETRAFESVPPDDPVAFARSVARLLRNGARREEMGRRGRRWVEENASRDAVLARHAAILRS